MPTSILCVALTALGQRSGLTAYRRVATSNVQSSGGRIQDTGERRVVVALRIPVLLDCRKPFPPYDNKHVPQHRLSHLWTD